MHEHMNDKFHTHVLFIAEEFNLCDQLRVNICNGPQRLVLFARGAQIYDVEMVEF
jgi:hypothetical protein